MFFLDIQETPNFNRICTKMVYISTELVYYIPINGNIMEVMVMTIKEMMDKKHEKGYTYSQIAELSGVPLGTVQKILNGDTKNPRYATLMALEMAFTETMPILVKETPATYYPDKQPGMYTIEDYRALPDDQRVELIDGHFYDMAAPTTFHQLIAGEIHRQISNYLVEQGGACTPFISPVDVQLNNDEHTMLQPDIVIVCNPDQIVRRNIVGAPDFVLEVISPETKRKDYITKLHKYEDAKVREYWLVDPYQKIVLVYFFESEAYPIIHPIDADIPVNIYEGKLVLKLQNITKWVESSSLD